MNDTFEISEALEKDVWFFSKKFGLTRMSFRSIMRSPMVANAVHSLSYDATAQELYDALLPAYEFSRSEQNRVSGENQVSRHCINGCMNHLRRIIESEP